MTLHDFVLRVRRMICFVVKVNESTFDVGEFFQFELQRLADVVRFAMSHVLGQHDVDFHKEVGAEVEGANRIDEFDFLVVIQRYPREFLEKIGSCRVSS